MQKWREGAEGDWSWKERWGSDHSGTFYPSGNGELIGDFKQEFTLALIVACRNSGKVSMVELILVF